MFCLYVNMIMDADSKCIHELVEDTKKTTYKAEFGANGETNKNGKLHLGLNDLIAGMSFLLFVKRLKTTAFMPVTHCIKQRCTEFVNMSGSLCRFSTHFCSQRFISLILSDCISSKLVKDVLKIVHTNAT